MVVTSVYVINYNDIYMKKESQLYRVVTLTPHSLTCIRPLRSLRQGHGHPLRMDSWRWRLSAASYIILYFSRAVSYVETLLVTWPLRPLDLHVLIWIKTYVCIKAYSVLIFHQATNFCSKSFDDLGQVRQIQGDVCRNICYMDSYAKICNFLCGKLCWT